MLSFARDAHDFRVLLDDYKALPFEVPAHVAGLTTSAQGVNQSIRAARGMESTHQDWQSIVDVLERMRLLLTGSDVAVPAPHVVAALSGLRLQEFQGLAAELATSANRAHESAKRDVGEYPGRGPQFLGELYHFAVQIRGLGQKSRRRDQPAEDRTARRRAARGCPAGGSPNARRPGVPRGLGRLRPEHHHPAPDGQPGAVMIIPTADGTPWAAPANASNGVQLSAFHIVALTFLRARELQAGARPRVESVSQRPTRVALFEVLSDAVSWSVSEAPPPVGDQPRTDNVPPPPDVPRRVAGARKPTLLGL